MLFLRAEHSVRSSVEAMIVSGFDRRLIGALVVPVVARRSSV
jgi:hypothetical protein